MTIVAVSPKGSEFSKGYRLDSCNYLHNNRRTPVVRSTGGHVVPIGQATWLERGLFRHWQIHLLQPVFSVLSVVFVTPVHTAKLSVTYKARGRAPRTVAAAALSLATTLRGYLRISGSHPTNTIKRRSSLNTYCKYSDSALMS